MKSSERFREILLSNREITKGDFDFLEDVSSRADWFSLSKVLQLKYSDIDICEQDSIREGISLSLVANSYYNVFNNKVEDFNDFQHESQDDLIGSFLSKNISKVNISESDVCSVVESKDVADDYESMVELAAFLVEIGEKKQAIQIYSKLNLNFPEKSAYFAKIIEELSK